MSERITQQTRTSSVRKKINGQTVDSEVYRGQVRKTKAMQIGVPSVQPIVSHDMLCLLVRELNAYVFPPDSIFNRTGIYFLENDDKRHRGCRDSHNCQREPGRVTELSRMSGLLVAPIMKTIFAGPTPSISVKI